MTQIKIKTDPVVCTLRLHYYNLVSPPSAAPIPYERNWQWQLVHLSFSLGFHLGFKQSPLWPTVDFFFIKPLAIRKMLILFFLMTQQNMLQPIPLLVKHPKNHLFDLHLYNSHPKNLRPKFLPVQAVKTFSGNRQAHNLRPPEPLFLLFLDDPDFLSIYQTTGQLLISHLTIEQKLNISLMGSANLPV